MKTSNPKAVPHFCCERHGCAPEKFEKEISWRNLYRHVVPVAALLRLLVGASGSAHPLTAALA